GPDDVEIIGHEDPFVRCPAIRQLQCFFPTPFANFHKSQELSENLSGITAIDLLDNENKLTVGLTIRSFDRLHEDSINKIEPFFSLRAPAAYEVFICERGVELNDT